MYRKRRNKNREIEEASLASISLVELEIRSIRNGATNADI